MKDETNGNVIVFNGEIYNHLELRKELLALGIAFRGHSDTETILRGYGAWGASVFSKLRGMFAFAIYNGASRSVTFCRDRLGIKPLYLGRGADGSLAFSSEVRPLLPFSGRRISEAGLSAFLHWGACPHGQLLFENLSEFPSGCWATVCPGQTTIKPNRYWPITDESPVFSNGTRAETLADAPTRVRQLLQDAVRSHLLSDVPISCFLSGGIDSSILVALASREMGGDRLSTFSVGFAEGGFDESKFAIQMAEQYGTNHHHIHLTDAEKLGCVVSGVAAMDLPSTDALNTFIVSNRVAQAGFKVVLSGLGADEIFGGYPIFRDFWLVRTIASTPRMLRNPLMALGKGRHLLSDIPDEKTGESLSCWWRRIWSGDMLTRYGLRVPEFIAEPSPPLRDAMGELSWGETSHYMRDMLLRDSDAMSMSQSLEIRVPFLDNHLVAEVLNLPAGQKFNPRIPKTLLLQATEGLIPKEIWNRPKMGFSLPMNSWMRGPLKDFCHEGLTKVHENGVLDSKKTAQLWAGFEAGAVRWPAIWATVTLGHYLGKQP